MTVAFIGLGSNQGDRMLNLATAVDKIAHLPLTHVEKVSHAHESAPAYDTDQPAFANAVAKVTSGLEPGALLAALLEIEDVMGRVRARPKGPRIIDLDLLAHGDTELVSDSLVLPHPGLAERDFVVTPLLEIEPRFTLPDGTHPRRSEALLGVVLRDLGPIPDKGAEHNMPIGDVTWEVVAESSDAVDSFAGFDAALALKREALIAEGIPYAFEPFEPAGDIDPLGQSVTFKLLVPAEHAKAVRELFEGLDAAQPLFPEQPEE